jgi:N-acyl-D-aspartate/D-glutamate deacylase
MGFSTTTAESHSDAFGQPVPSRWAGRDEFVALARVCGEFPGTSLEMLPRGAAAITPFEDDVADLMIDMSVAAGRPLNWNVIQPTAKTLDMWLAKLAVGDRAQARGGKVVGLTMPIDMKARFSFHAGFVLDMFDGWSGIMALPVREKLACFQDPAQRAELQRSAEGTAAMRHLARWDDLVLVETFTEENQAHCGRRVGDVAAELGKQPFDTLVDIAIADGLRTTFARNVPPPTDADWDARVQLCRDKRALIGASDAGAHLDMIAAFRYSTGLLQEAVRERGLLSMEEAVHHLTGGAARLYGLHDRGLLREGAAADILIVDEDTVGSGPIGTRFDLPGGAGRLYAEAIGIDHVLVNGVEIAAGGVLTGALPGRVLRSGVDTRTPTMAL